MPAYLIRVAMVPELFDVVDHAVELPLLIHLGAPPQRKSGELFVVCKLPNTGSTVVNLSAINCSLSAESMRSFIRSVWELA